MIPPITQGCQALLLRPHLEQARVAFWAGSTLLYQRALNAKWLKLGLPVGIGALILLGLRLRKKGESLPPPPLLAYNKMHSYVEPHPLERTGLDCKGPSPLANYVGIVAPDPGTLATYASWFSFPKIWEIPPGSYYFYQIDTGYRCHFLGKEGASSEEVGLADFPGYIGKKEKALGIPLTPINYPLMVDIQSCLLLKFGGSAVQAEDVDDDDKQFTVAIPKQGNQTLGTYPLQHTFTVNVICQGVTHSFKLHLSPYQVTTDNEEVLADFRDAPSLVDLQIEVVTLFERVLEKADKVVEEQPLPV